MEDELNIEYKQKEDLIVCEGSLGHSVDYRHLELLLQKTKIIHLENVKRVSSIGLSGWISFFRDFYEKTPGVKITLSNCSFPFTDAMCMLPELCENFIVESVWEQYYCFDCQIELEKLRELNTKEDIQNQLMEEVSLTCNDCGEELDKLTG